MKAMINMKGHWVHDKNQMQKSTLGLSTNDPQSERPWCFFRDINGIKYSWFVIHLELWEMWWDGRWMKCIQLRSDEMPKTLLFT